jgi:hypothetical protein
MRIAPPRSLGSGTFDEDGVCWSVEKSAQRMHCHNQPLKTVAVEEFVHLSGLREEEVQRLLSKTKDNSVLIANEDDVCASLTPSSLSSSPSSSLSSSPSSSICADDDDDDDACSSDCSDDNSSDTQPLQVELTEPDVYGQRHPIENETLIAYKLREFGDEIKKLCPNQSVNLLTAERLCPELVMPSFKLIFLRCECFDAEVRPCRSCWCLFT